MRPTKTKKTKTSKNPETQNPEAATPAENQAPEASGKPEKAGKGSREGVRIVSVAFPSKVARQLRLLASVEGVSIASIVVGSVSRTISKRLPAALEAIAKADAEGG